ncbi:ZIP family metal transporter [Effusibacillus pohliae]|uniref:ZIP family metal transporter n=1 Tax=Effusibacillus pohliae TaxID=232270 RepID=UPI00037883BD|nr:ZIP family metal transporter [Effusibacillus pohliae]
MSESTYILLLVIVTSIANILGGVLITARKNWSRNALNSFMALGAGFLLAIAVVDLLPESLAVAESNGYYVLLGFLSVYLFQHVVATHFHFGEETHGGHHHSSRIGILIGMLTHTFFDGVAIASSFEVDLGLGALVFLAVLVHKIPDGLTIASITLASNGSRRQALLSSVYLGLSTLLGALSVVWLGEFAHSEALIGVALAFSAGVFLYVGGTDLLPAVNATENRKYSLFVLLGVILFLIGAFAFHGLGLNEHEPAPHQQEHHHAH